MERKVKYDYAFRLECVELVLKKKYSAEYVSKLKQTARWNIRKWSVFIRHMVKLVGSVASVRVKYKNLSNLKVSPPIYRMI